MAAAKRNLAAPCTRYLLLDKLDDGLAKMRERLPDFDTIGLKVSKGRASDSGGAGHTNDSKSRMTAALQARLDGYLADAELMGRLRAVLAAEIQVFDFAVGNYAAQWAKDLRTC